MKSEKDGVELVVSILVSMITFVCNADDMQVCKM